MRRHEDEETIISRKPNNTVWIGQVDKEGWERTRKQRAAHGNQLKLRLLDLDPLQGQVKVVHRQLNRVWVELELLGNLAHPVHDDGPVLQVPERLVYGRVFPLAHTHGAVHLPRVDTWGAQGR